MTGRLSSLVGEILDVTHLQADPLILERAPVSFAVPCHPTAGRPRRRRSGGPTGRPPAGDLPPLEVDGARVGQILENLVGNAFKYGPADEPRDISAVVDGEWLVVAVDDEGSGSRPRNGRSSPSRSTGPGTSANRASPARASVCSSPAAWSRRTAAGCAWRTGRTDGPGRASRSPPLLRGSPTRTRLDRDVAPSRWHGRGRRVTDTILIVEDEPDFAALVELWMGRAGYGPSVARTGTDALRRFYERPPGPGDPRRLAARARRLADHRAHPRVQPHPDHAGHGAQLRDRQDPWPQARRRRLHHQAAELPRVDCAGRGGTPPRLDRHPGSPAPAPASRPRRSISTSTGLASAARRSG